MQKAIPIWPNSFTACCMPLNSPLYIVFLLLTVALYWVLPPKWRAGAMGFFSVAFYAYVGWWQVAVLFGLTLWTYLFAQLLYRTTTHARLVASIGFLVLVLTLYKYASQLGVQNNLIMPLGMSYVIFELIHVLADVYRKAIPTVQLKDLFLFAFFFPTKSAGPIKRFSRFVEQSRSPVFQWSFLHYSAMFLLLGFAQKIIIADPLASFTAPLAQPELLRGSLDALFHLYLYSIRIYADFAGLSNIAIGSALLFGVLVPKNFAYPYLRPNIALFWRNWHMSLSDWARDYIYIPLGGNRVAQWRTLLHLLLVMLIIGIWHGSSLNFAVWGIYHGVGLVVHRLWSSWLGNRTQNTIGYALGVLVTFHFVTLGWALFVTSSLTDSWTIIRTLFSF